LSNVIKSFRVVESNNYDLNSVSLKSSSLYNEIYEDAKKKYDYIIRKAEKKAEEIMDLAYDEYDKQLNIAYEKSKSIYEDSKKKGYDDGYKLGINDGYDEGYKKGYDEGRKKAEELIKEALEIKAYYNNRRSKMLKDTEKDLIELVITIYEKVLDQKVKEDENYIISLVLNGIEGLEIKDKLTIITSQEDYEILKNNEDIILAKASLIDSIEIRVNSEMQKGDCILETSKGNIDVSLNNQLEEIKEFLYTILNNE